MPLFSIRISGSSWSNNNKVLTGAKGLGVPESTVGTKPKDEELRQLVTKKSETGEMHRKNPTISQLLVADDVESITSSNYNPSDPTVVVAHGYLGNANTNLNVVIRNGLDPFSPIWQFNSNRLSNADGVYVEVIHTNGAGNGVTSPMGDADFYPNGGNSQPGCITSICNHNRSWELFAATVEHNHLVGTECSSSNDVAANNCRGKQFNMGNADLKKSGNGLYRLNTLARYPY
ncbi:unnamed protein product, partial [Iphiclides podalirius]